jgi:two-component system OmpR family sensor kinase
VIRSLRSRLLLSVLGIAAFGLVLLGAVTYAEQRSFLYQRVDQQVHRAPLAVGRALSARGIGPPPGDGDRAQGGGPGPGDLSDLPAGTYGQLRDSTGRVLGAGPLVRYGASTTARPNIPRKVSIGKPFTVSGVKGDTTHYRVLATRSTLFGGVTIVTVVAVPLREVEQTLHRLLLVEVLVILGVLFALGFVSWAVVRIGLLPLDRIGHTAGAIAGGDLSHRVEDADPRTEVGRLGLSLNAMLDRLEGAFSERQASEDRLRRFLADASHELRTPLSSIRGYAELFRMGAAREPGDLERSMARIEDEAARMGVLVEDLLTLARLDEIADAPHTEVDLGALARDAVDDARATAPDRDIELHGDAGAVVSGDAHQLRQVLGNLVRNALVHTPPGTRIDVSTGRENGQVSLEVRDHGPGLPEGADPNAVFERFWRSEAGRERGKDGAGLGLAIVAGIVEAHGGTVRATNAEGGGASFVVRLPAPTE